MIEILYNNQLYIVEENYVTTNIADNSIEIFGHIKSIKTRPKNIYAKYDKRYHVVIDYILDFYDTRLVNIIDADKFDLEGLIDNIMEHIV